MTFVVLSVILWLGGCGGGGDQTVIPTGQSDINVLGEPVTVPQGVEPDLMAQLAQALEQQLLSQGGRGLSDVTGVYIEPLTRVDIGMDVELSWAYNNTGDYDQNGEVNIADLSPIGSYFGATSADADWAAASVADGDGNGEVNIADISPIGANFSGVVSNYCIDANCDGSGDWQPVANVPLSDGVKPTAGGLMQFTGLVLNGCQAPGVGTEVFRVSAGPEANPLHEFPTWGWSALLTISPMSGYAPMETSCTIYFFEDAGPFDVEINFGDSTANYTGTSMAGEDLVVPHTFAALGMYNVTGTVTNVGSLGGELPISKQVEVVEFSYQQITAAENWVEIVMESGQQWGKHSAIALVGGLPMMVYTRDDREEIYFARATVPRPTIASDWVQMTLDDGDDRGGTLGIAEVQGVPCVVFEDVVGQDTYFSSATSAAPVSQADWVTHGVNTSEPNCTQTQIASVGGVPGLVYVTGGGVRYAFSIMGPAMLPTSNADWFYEDIDTSGFMAYPQIAEVNGVPVVAYQRADGGWKELRYAWRDAGFWTATTVDDLDKNSGNSIRLQLIGDTASPGVALAYQNVDIVSYLRYATCPIWNAAIVDPWTTMTVRYQDQTHVGNWLGMAWFHDRPFMSYVNTGSGSTAGLQISVAINTVPAGPDDFDHAILDDATGYFINEQTSVLALDDSTLFILYRTSEGLKFAYFAGP